LSTMKLRRLGAVLPAILYAALLYWLSSRPRWPLPRLGLGFEDKIAHLAAYALLSALTYLALTRPSPVVRRPHVWATILALAYALSDEWHQRHVPGRFFEVLDLAADALGIVSAQLAIAWHRLRRAGRPSESGSARKTV